MLRVWRFGDEVRRGLHPSHVRPASLIDASMDLQGLRESSPCSRIRVCPFYSPDQQSFNPKRELTVWLTHPNELGNIVIRSWWSITTLSMAAPMTNAKSGTCRIRWCMKTVSCEQESSSQNICATGPKPTNDRQRFRRRSTRGWEVRKGKSGYSLL